MVQMCDYADSNLKTISSNLVDITRSPLPPELEVGSLHYHSTGSREGGVDPCATARGGMVW